MKEYIFKTVLLYSFLVIFAACSGGGGGGGSRLSFTAGPVTTSAVAAIPAIEVQILDAAGNLDTTATDVVTLSLGALQPEILIHQSGSIPSVLEVVDLATQDQLGWFESQPGNEIGGMAFDEDTGTLYYTVRTGLASFFSLDPATDTQTLISIGTPDEIKGIAFNSAGTVLYAVASSNSGLNVDSLYSLNTTNGVATEIGTIVPDAGTISGFTGLATDPLTGTIYAVTKFSSPGPGMPAPRALTTINPLALALTTIGPLNETGGNNAVSGISFASDGTLYAVTGDGSTDNPESLFTVNKTTAVLTLPASLDIIQSNSDGESISIIPAPLLGTVSVAAVGGVATFNNVKLAASATGYTLVATANGYRNATSRAFDITPIAGIVGSIQLASASQTVGEAVGNVTVTVNIDNPQTHDVVVAMTVTGTATGSGTDHDINISNFFNITIPAEELSAFRTFTVVDDLTPEATETVIFTIENASLAVIGATTVHTVTINDND